MSYEFNWDQLREKCICGDTEANRKRFKNSFETIGLAIERIGIEITQEELYALVLFLDKEEWESQISKPEQTAKTIKQMLKENRGKK